METFEANGLKLHRIAIELHDVEEESRLDRNGRCVLRCVGGQWLDEVYEHGTHCPFRLADELESYYEAAAASYHDHE